MLVDIRREGQNFIRTAANIFQSFSALNPLNAELNFICHLLALLGAHHILHVSRIRVNSFHEFSFDVLVPFSII
jgi:hypothetical protein